MAVTIEEAFREFLGSLTPLGLERNAAKNHRASIYDCLSSNFSITNFFRTGSFGNGTSIRGYSDVDYFACIPTENLTQNSVSTLIKVKNVLARRFPNTGIVISSPAVQVPFGINKNELTEVTPADFIKTGSNGYDVYEIADGKGGWIQSSPDAHNAYVSYVDNSLSNKVKPLIRFIKAWKYYRDVPIKSFYLELRVAKYASGESSIIYSIDLRNIIKLLLDNELASIQDPMGVSGLISVCSSNVKKTDSISKLKVAFVRAEKAIEAEDAGDIRKAIYWWNQVFANRFPKYG